MSREILSALRIFLIEYGWKCIERRRILVRTGAKTARSHFVYIGSTHSMDLLVASEPTNAIDFMVTIRIQQPQVRSASGIRLKFVDGAFYMVDSLMKDLLVVSNYAKSDWISDQLKSGTLVSDQPARVE